MPATKTAPAAKPAKAKSAPAPAPAPAAKAAPKAITILVPEPKLRGSRAARWELVLKAKDAAELATLLKEGGWKQSAAGTIRWLTKAKLIALT